MSDHERMGLFVSTYTNQEKGVKSSDTKHQLKLFKCSLADCNPLVLPLSWWLCFEAQKSSFCLATVPFSHKLEAGGELEDLRWRLLLLICCREVFEWGLEPATLCFSAQSPEATTTLNFGLTSEVQWLLAT